MPGPEQLRSSVRLRQVPGNVEPGFHAVRQRPSGKMTPLPRPSIDTGLGLERSGRSGGRRKEHWESDLFNR